MSETKEEYQLNCDMMFNNLEYMRYQIKVLEARLNEKSKIYLQYVHDNQHLHEDKQNEI